MRYGANQHQLKAAVYREYGPPEVVRIEDVEKPRPKDNEVLVRIHATTVCAADWRLRKADPFFVRLINGVRHPKKLQILGMEFSGTVESAGRAVTRFRAGDQIFGGTGFKFGAHAEYLCVAEDRAVSIKPVNMPLEDAAAICFGGMTALHFLKQANIQPGEKVLIYGSSGSVGVFAVQLAKHYGAHVTAVCSTRNLELVKALGADEVVDYTREDFSKADFSKAGRIYDVIFDTVGYSGLGRCMKALKRGGRYAQGGYAGLSTLLLEGIIGQSWISLTGRAKVLGGMVRPNPADVSFLKDLVEAGKLRTVIDKSYSLGQIGEAHRHAESGHKRGHVVVLLNSL